MKRNSETVFTVKRVVEYDYIEKTDLVVYEETIEEIYENKSDESKNNVTKSKRFGVTHKDNIEKADISRGISDDCPAERLYKGTAVIRMISKKNYQAIMEAKKFVYDDDVMEKPTKENINSKEYIMIMWNHGSHTIADLCGAPISIPIKLSYMDGYLSNGYYKLKEVMKTLRENIHVVNRESLEYLNIPYYNASKDNTKHIEAYVLLPQDVYEDYFKYPSYERNHKILTEFLDCKKYRKNN